MTTETRETKRGNGGRRRGPLTSQAEIRDQLRESQLFLQRALIALLLLLLLCGAIVAQLVRLQVVEHEHFRTLSRENHVRIQPLPPTRGMIYDRNGVVLADNLPAWSLELVPERTPDIEAALAGLTGLIGLTEAEIDRFRKLHRRAVAGNRRFESIPLRMSLSEQDFARFAVQRWRYPGADVQARLIRHYPDAAFTSHAVGYVGRISEDDLERLDSTAYRGSTHTGKTGIEKQYEALLHGTTGIEAVEANTWGRVLRVLERTPPRAGQDLHLYLDMDLQREAEAALGENNGAVVAIETETGGVVALVSKPGFDSNLFVAGIDRATYQALNTSRDRPLFNRALRGQYPPGSTIKPFVALGGLHHRVVTTSTPRYCRGWFALPGQEHHYRCWKRTGHGSVALSQGVVQSCDVYFYDLAWHMGIDRLHDFLDRFNLGRPTGIDIEGEQAGILPSPAWKRAARNEPWYAGETVIAGIGQGYMLTTPLQLATATAVMAHRGAPIVPRLVRATGRPGETPGTLPIEPPADHNTDVRAEDWQAVLDAMRDVVHSPSGTARRVAPTTYTMAGKTGTAQVFGLRQDEKYDASKIEKHLRDHALFIAFAPVEAPRIAVAVIAENGGGGGGTAAPIARRILDRYFRTGTP